MTVWPVLERELRLRARTPATYWTRLAIVLIGSTACLPNLLWDGALGRPAALGRGVFDGIVVAAFFLAGCSFLLTIDVVSRERREGTLELLLLTSIRSGDLLLGKLGSSGLAAFSGLFAFLPILMIPVLAGGVTGGDVFRIGLALLNTAFFTLTAGLWASASPRHQGKWRRLFTLSFVVVILPLLFESSVAIHFKISPVQTLIAAEQTRYLASPFDYWISLGAVHLLGWVLLAWAGANVTATVLPETETSGGSRRAFRKHMRNPRFRPAQGIVDPVEFLVSRQRGLGYEIWGFVAIEVLYYGFSWLCFSYVAGAFAVYLIWPVWIFSSVASDALLAHAAARFFLDSRHSGQLELLITTPLAAREILSGQGRALKRFLRWPLAVLITVISLETISSLNFLPENVPLVYYVGSLSLNIAVTLAGITAVCWVGIWLAFQGHKKLVVITRAVGLGTVLPAAFRAFVALLLDERLLRFTYGGWPWMIKSWLEEIVILAYFFWLFRFARNRLNASLPDAESGHSWLVERLISLPRSVEVSLR